MNEKLRFWGLDAGKLARSYRCGDLTPVWAPDEDSEALRDLVRARVAAKQDQLRARHWLNKFLLRPGQRPPAAARAWTHLHLIWVSQMRFTQIAQESTRLDYLHEVEHTRERAGRLERVIVETVKLASPTLQEVFTDRCVRSTTSSPARPCCHARLSSAMAGALIRFSHTSH